MHTSNTSPITPYTPVHTSVHRGVRRDPLALAAALLACVAFAGSYTHVHTVVSEHGQAGWIGYAIALMPEASVALVVLKITRARRTGESVAWAWTVGTTAAIFTLAANLADAEPSIWGYVAAGWPAWSSIGALGLMHSVHTPAVHEPAVHTPDTPPAVHTPAVHEPAVHTPDTPPAVHTSPVHEPAVHTPDTPPASSAVHTPDTPLAVCASSAHSSDAPVTADADTLRKQGVSTVRGAMRVLRCGQARAKAALAILQMTTEES